MRSPQRAPAKSSKPAPRDARWVKRRAAAAMRIEKAGLELFAEHGFEAIAAEDIAAAAGISRRSFYRYFDSTEEVLMAMPRRSLARISRDYRARPAAESPFEAFAGALRQSQHTDEERELHRLAFTTMMRSPKPWELAMAKMQAETMLIYEDMIASRLRNSGRDASTAGMIAAALSAIMLQACREGERARKPLTPDRVGPTADQIEAGVIAFVDAVNSGRATRPRRSSPIKPKK